MSDFNKIDLKGFALNSTIEVFNTMLSMKLDVLQADPIVKLTGNRLVGCVGLAGNVMGNICIHVSKEFARIMAAAMLGMEIDEIEEDEINDVIGEVCNMISGDLKSRLCDAGFSCVLSIPSVTSGSDFKIESKGWVRHERIAFENRNEKSIVEVFIKSVI